jgi:carboxyl-terminal processing protease
MAFKGRTVIAFILLAMFAGSIVTLTLIDTLDASSFTERRKQQEKPADQKPTALQGLTEQELQKISSTFGLIHNNFYNNVERSSIVDGAIDGMLGALEDPYSVYMDPEETKQFGEHIESVFSGIGAEVSMRDGKVTIVSPIKGSPAERAGIRAGDVIISVNGESLEGFSLNEAVMKIRGKKGTQAKLQIQRETSSSPIEIIVVRDDISMETVFSEMLEDDIGYIEIRQFAQNTADHFKEQLTDLEAKQMRGLIIDVRNDPGGILPVVTEIADLFVPEGKAIVQIENRNGERQKQYSSTPGKEYPVTLLMNKGSASASEILAGAIKESAGGILVGETTYGKGTVQSTFESAINDGSSYKMTIAKWLTPIGNFINEKGIAPDVLVELPDIYKVAPLPKDQILKFDMVSDDVRNLQLILEGLDLGPGRSDGYFSEKTVLSVKAFQRLNDLPMTGEVDEATAVKMEEKLIEWMQKPENDIQLNKAIEVTKKQL